MRLIDADAFKKWLLENSINEREEKESRQIGIWIDAFPSAEPEQQWISVFDKLPGEGQIVVALEKGKTWDCMAFEGTAEWTEDERMWKKKEAVIRIDYWMPKDSALPEPYKEEGEQK